MWGSNSSGNQVSLLGQTDEAASRRKSSIDDRNIASLSTKHATVSRRRSDGLSSRPQDQENSHSHGAQPDSHSRGRTSPFDHAPFESPVSHSRTHNASNDQNNFPVATVRSSTSTTGPIGPSIDRDPRPVHRHHHTHIQLPPPVSDRGVIYNQAHYNLQAADNARQHSQQQQKEEDLGSAQDHRRNQQAYLHNEHRPKHYSHAAASASRTYHDRPSTNVSSHATSPYNSRAADERRNHSYARPQYAHPGEQSYHQHYFSPQSSSTSRSSAIPAQGQNINPGRSSAQSQSITQQSSSSLPSDSGPSYVRDSYSPLPEGTPTRSVSPQSPIPAKKKYPCPFARQYGCDDTFSTSGHAARHGKKHTGEKSVSCPTCGKAFTRKDNMKQHERTHKLGSTQSSSVPSADSSRIGSRDQGAVNQPAGTLAMDIEDDMSSNDADGRTYNKGKRRGTIKMTDDDQKTMDMG